MFIKKIFEGKFDEETKLELLKYSRGEFNKKYRIEAKNKKNFVIKSDSDFANYFVRKGLELSKEKIQTKGIIVSTTDITIPFSEEKKQFMGIKQYKVNTKIDPKEVLEFINKNPKLFFALSFSFPGFELKIKPKMPKSPKPSTKGEVCEDVSPSFCSLKTSCKEIIKDLFFDVSENFKEILVEHTIKIDEIIYPENFQKMKPEEIREKSKRKGKIIRKLIIDEKERISEANFVC